MSTTSVTATRTTILTLISIGCFNSPLQIKASPATALAKVAICHRAVRDLIDKPRAECVIELTDDGQLLPWKDTSRGAPLEPRTRSGTSFTCCTRRNDSGGERAIPNKVRPAPEPSHRRTLISAGACALDASRRVPTRAAVVPGVVAALASVGLSITVNAGHVFRLP